ncbi:MAG: hypothetical protein H8E10_09540 [Desulfobacterales bacterium]|nr:hypothetical protein [Desulfobacterales bacterium]MBL7102020.1 hypothetical protein [Desulfobacteraceae bacterium]MBL7172764.1 hypothetical protein [Desulfobacteraceae bacterium]
MSINISIPVPPSPILIVSGDRHLLDPESFNNIQIVTQRKGALIIVRLQHTTPVPSVLSNCASAMPKRSLEVSWM